MEEDKVNNINKEYLSLRADNSKRNLKKGSSNRKISSGILKRRTMKSHTLIEKERITKSSKSIIWDNKSIDEQKNSRKEHHLDKEKLKQSKSKFSNNITYNEDDVYMKELNKVNQINDEFIQKVIKALSGKEKYMKRIKSCLTFGKFQRRCDLSEFYEVTEKENMFDESLGKEQKLTLQNTLYNKISKGVIEIY